ncbi:hypothetical protein GOP47_0016832 [Adiantum capillus-veneris]|uniref:Uncharacterized protein n=1 Tax=Adiantum capillus-veneris TaxID=13818 RepID=A0A9D4UJ39_ADICA|nr:hypothetical protein GOP47_0016832 [Adiantum capillus-veneris]
MKSLVISPSPAAPFSKAHVRAGAAGAAPIHGSGENLSVAANSHSILHHSSSIRPAPATADVSCAALSLPTVRTSSPSVQLSESLKDSIHKLQILDVLCLADAEASTSLISAPHPSNLNLAFLLHRELDRMRAGGGHAAALAICNVADTLITCLLSPPQLQPSVDPRIQLRRNSFPVLETPPTPCPVTSGTLPADLNGAYIRNGPNPAHLHNGEGFHLFDGDGMLHCVSFHHGSVPTYSARYVKTSRFLQEEAAGRPLFPKFFGSLSCVFGMARAAVMLLRARLGLLDLSQGSGLSNTNVGFLRGKVLSISEEDLPYVIKVTEAGDLVSQGRLEMPGRRSICTHPKFDPETGDMYAFSYPDPSMPRFSIFTVRAEAGGDGGGEVLPVPGLLDLPIVHDFAMTRKYIIFPDSELVMSPLAFVRGEGVAKRDPQKVARFCVLPRDIFDRPHQAAQEARWFDAPGCNAMHYLNAWDDEESHEVVLIAPVVSQVDDALSLTGVFSTVSEIRLNTKTGEVTSRKLCAGGLELGTMNYRYAGSKSRYAYFAEGSCFPHAKTAVVKVDVQAGRIVARRTFTVRCSTSEPCFVPRRQFCVNEDALAHDQTVSFNADSHHNNNSYVSQELDEDDGYLLCFLHNNNSNCSELLVMNAMNDLSPPLEVISSIKLPTRVPFGLHGFFVRDDQLDMQNP